jgi:hypothetical protein
VVEPLPSDREERLLLLRDDSLEYVRRMGGPEVTTLLNSLARTEGLAGWEVRRLVVDRWRGILREASGDG